MTLDLDRFYEVGPIIARLVGGPAGGRQLAIPDDRETWLMPAEPEGGLLATITATWSRARAGPETVTDKAAVYRRVSVRDDGVRLFRYDPSASR